jgi:DNA-binding transcriptional LysR family regulator
MFPMATTVEVMRTFAKRFPTVPPRIYVETLGQAAELVSAGTCSIGLINLAFSDIAAFKSLPLLTIDLIPVVASGHPLATIEGPIQTQILQQHVQLVVTDRSVLTAGRDYGVLSARTWRLADLSAKHAMLVAGIGWGNMPSHTVKGDIAGGRLKVIHPVEFDRRVAKLSMGCVYRADRQLGPAGQWLIRHLSGAIDS